MFACCGRRGRHVEDDDPVKPLDGGRGTAYPDMTWEPKAAFVALAEMYVDD